MIGSVAGTSISRRLDSLHCLLLVHILPTKSNFARRTKQMKLENLSSPIDMYSHTGSTFDNRVTLSLDLLDLSVNACPGPAIKYVCTEFWC